MTDGDKSETRRGLTAEERAILCRVSYDAWREWCRREGLVLPYGLPPHYTPVSRRRAMELLDKDDAADHDDRRRLKQNVASLYALGDPKALTELHSTFHPRYEKNGLVSLAQLKEQSCPCCHAARAWNQPTTWFLRHRFKNATIATFNPETQVTDIRSTYYVSAPQNVTKEQVAAMMKALAEAVDPKNWSHAEGSSFKRSEPIELSTRPDLSKQWFEGGVDWRGKLIESFELTWNSDAAMAVDNLLNVHFRVVKDEDDQEKSRIRLDYSLSESLSSKLWLARQAGGLDIDRGHCEVRDLGTKKLNIDPTRPPKVIDIHAKAPSREQFGHSNHYNIVVITTKTLRFTPVQGAPSWFSTLINYQTPVLGGIWMSQAIQAGIAKAIETTRQTTVNKIPDGKSDSGTVDIRSAG